MNKIEKIKNLFSRGFSIGLATLIVTGGLTACDKTPDDPIVDDTKNPSVSDTIETPSESTPVETLSPEILENYPNINTPEYVEFVNDIINSSSAFSNGIDLCFFEIGLQNEAFITLYCDNLKSIFRYETDAKYFNDLPETIKNQMDTIKLGFPEGHLLYTLNIDDNLSPSDKKILFTAISDAYNQRKTTCTETEIENDLNP